MLNFLFLKKDQTCVITSSIVTNFISYILVYYLLVCSIFDIYSGLIVAIFCYVFFNVLFYFHNYVDVIFFFNVLFNFHNYVDVLCSNRYSL